MALSIQLGAKVQRRNYNGMDTPGAVVRWNEAEIMVYWPQDNFYEVVPAVELEPYGAIAA